MFLWCATNRQNLYNALRVNYRREKKLYILSAYTRSMLLIVVHKDFWPCSLVSIECKCVSVCVRAHACACACVLACSIAMIMIIFITIQVTLVRSRERYVIKLMLK